MRTSISSDGGATALQRDEIRQHALSLGFDSVGFAAAELGPKPTTAFAAFIAEGAHGDMTWLANRAPERSSPQGLWSAAKTVIAVGMNYAPQSDPMASLGSAARGTISVYARGDDYHDVMKKRLKALGRWVGEYLDTEVKVFVDTAPVLEKPLAMAAGVGWQGKHTNVVSRSFGSWLFLGEIFVAAALPFDPPHVDRCGSCHRCLTICPTDAFPEPYRLDARRCISYLTIEHKGHIDRALRPLIGNRIYGCDDCLAVCPWNRFAQESHHAQLLAREDLNAPTLDGLVSLDDTAFRALFRKSPIKRIGRARFVRNVLIAIGNSGLAELMPSAIGRLRDDSPLVRAMAVWALGRLADRETFDRLTRDHADHESDDQVRDEWRKAMAQ